MFAQSVGSLLGSGKLAVDVEVKNMSFRERELRGERERRPRMKRRHQAIALAPV